MGNINEISSIVDYEDENDNIIVGFGKYQLDTLKEEYATFANPDGTMNINLFQDKASLTTAEAIKLFDFFDLDKDQKVTFYEFLCGFSVLNSAKMEVKAEILWDFYDSDHDGFVDLKELQVLAQTALTQINMMSGDEPPEEHHCIAQAKEWINTFDKIKLDEWQNMFLEDMTVIKMIYQFGLISRYGGGEQIPEWDPDLDEEIRKAQADRDERLERIKNGIELKIVSDDEKLDFTSEQLKKLEELEQKEQTASFKWIEIANNLKPNNFKYASHVANPPAANLKMQHVYGFRCHDTRNNLKILPSSEILYTAAAIVIIYNSDKHSQRYYLEHNDDVTAIDICVTQNLVATGQLGSKPIICIWDPTTLQTKVTISGILINGISNVSFNQDGSKIAAVGLDDLHSIVVYDYKQVIKARLEGDGRPTRGLIAKGTNTRSACWDLMFSFDDKSIICSSQNEIGFFTYYGGMLKKTKGIWDPKTTPMSCLCNGRIEDKVITGMFKGTLIVWDGVTCKQIHIQKAHSGPCVAMCTRTKTKGIVTGGNDGEVRVWDWVDGTLKEVKAYHLQELEKQLDIQNLKVSAVFEDQTGRLIIGTRGSEIIELAPSTRVLVRGHFEGELNGMCVNPNQNIFYTCGQDRMVAGWNMTTRQPMAIFKVERPSNHIEISPDGRVLAIGSAYGEVYFYKPSDFEQKDKDPEMLGSIDQKFDGKDEPVICMKFTPDSKFLCAAFENNQVIMYDTKNFKETIKFKTKNNAVKMAFSTDSTVVMINTLTEDADNDPDADPVRTMDIEIYDAKTGSTMNKQLDKIKSKEWATTNCIASYMTQGIWPACSLGTDVNCCDLAKKAGVLATGDDFSKIKLFKYPCHTPGSGYQKFSGHAANVTKVKFSFDEKYLITTGGEEKSIIQWIFDFDEAANNEQIKSMLAPEEPVQQVNVYQDDQNKGKPSSNLPFQGQLKDPSWYTRNDKKFNKLPAGQLELYYAFGFRTQYMEQVDEVRNMCVFLSDGKVAFTTASVAIMMDVNKNEQTFYQQHDNDIVSFDKHPTQDFIATGQMAQKGHAKQIDINVFNAQTKKTLATLNDFHLRAVIVLKFSPQGTSLLTIGMDNDNSLAIYDWMGSRLITTSKVDKSKVNAAAWKNENEFMTVGARHVKFWTLCGRNLDSKNGLFGTGNFQPQLCCVYTGDGKAISGGIDGNLYLWTGNKASKGISAHTSKVGSIILYQDQIITGGYDGLVLLWNNSLSEKSSIVDIAAATKYKDMAGITSLSLLGDQLLIGNLAAELYMQNLKGQTAIRCLMNGHFQGELWGAACSFNSDNFVTSGGDRTLRIWDIPNKKMKVGSERFKIDIRAVDWANNGKFIIAGDVEGNIYSINPVNLEKIDTKKSFFANLKIENDKMKRWIEDIKISADCKYVALGAHGVSNDSVVDVWSIIDGTWKLDINFQMKPKFTSAITHLDWSSDSQYIIANSQAKELQYYDVKKKGGTDSTSVKDVNWFQFTCTFGWPVQGIFQSSDFSEVNCVGRSFGLNFQPKQDDKENQYGKYAIATGDDNGDVNLYNWPVVVKKQVHKTYSAHSSHVCRVKFTYKDNYLVSVGGNDKSIFVWKTDFGGQGGADESDDDVGGVKPKQKKQKPDQKNKEKNFDPNAIFQEEDLEKGDEFAACKPWLGAIKAPSDFQPDKNMGKMPKVSPQLEYVFGVREKDVRNNVRYTSTKKIAYHIAGVGIVLDPTQNTQTFFQQHTDDIIAMDVSQDGTLAATGEIGPKPYIYVWNLENKEVKVKWNSPLMKGITAIAFNPSATRIAAVSLNQADQFPYAVFDVMSGEVIYSDKSGPAQILELSWLNDNEFAGCGNKTMIMWTVGTGKPPVTSKKGIFDACSNKVCTITAYNNDYVCGGADGWVVVFQGGSANKSKSTKEHHQGVVECVNTANGFLLSGCQGGTITIWDKTYQPLTKILTKTAKQEGVIQCALTNKYARSIRSLKLSFDNQKMLIATYGSEILELSLDSGKIVKDSKFDKPNVLMTGHYTPCQKWTNEIWGLDVFKKDEDKFCSCGDDGTLRVYSVKAKKQIAICETTLNAKKQPENPDKKTGDPADSTKGRCVGVNKAGNLLGVGMKDGTIKTYKLAKEVLTQDKCFKKAKEWISDIQFSHDDKKFAFGSHDNKIYIFNSGGKKWKPMGKGPLNKHSSYITHFDFSEDGNTIHSTCGAYELLFWDLKKFKQNPSGATAYRDEPWLTWTCTLGWPVQGIWPECADGTDINAVARSNDKKYVCTADDFSTLKIFTYPCLKKGAEFTEGKGHSSHVTNCKWNNKDDYIFTSGGEDQAIMIWKVK